MPKKWTEKDSRNLIRFLLIDDKETLRILENAWSVNDRYDRYIKKYGVKDAQTVTSTKN